jgi:hypothetical protein
MIAEGKQYKGEFQNGKQHGLGIEKAARRGAAAAMQGSRTAC